MTATVMTAGQPGHAVREHLREVCPFDGDEAADELNEDGGDAVEG